ncbi:hypothetical protein BJ508DRAFT_410208 [Ascobolus immersus RN42]|uniref:C2H2-type domain-containing protein n=1 Tax=Ascobolus immersus RN42 TaxID=1160509 RepID=A0A3N4ITC6_ASCIM|nr:hypothetical protein BJ508DRAFT_410208 [Ascobolus immersus RN42]
MLSPRVIQSIRRTAPTAAAPTIINPGRILNLSSSDYSLTPQSDGTLAYKITTFTCPAPQCTSRFPSPDLLRRHHNERHHPGHPSSLYPTTQTEIKGRRAQVEDGIKSWSKEVKRQGLHESQHKAKRGREVPGCFVSWDKFEEEDPESIPQPRKRATGRIWPTKATEERQLQTTISRATRNTSALRVAENGRIWSTKTSTMEEKKEVSDIQSAFIDLRSPEPESQRTAPKIEKTVIDLLSDSSEGSDRNYRKGTRRNLTMAPLSTRMPSAVVRDDSVQSNGSVKRGIEDVSIEDDIEQRSPKRTKAQ